MDSDRRKNIIDRARRLCAENDAELLFLTIVGSDLFGTNIPGRSDVDVKGIFLPSLSSLALCHAPQSLHYRTGDGVHGNSSADIDLDLWSLQHWLMKLLPGGDTGASDLLFSPSNPECTLVCDARMHSIFQTSLRFLNLSDIESCTRYCISQAKKYGIKGSRLGALKAVWRHIQELTSHSSQSRLADIIPGLLEACPDRSFCSIETMPTGERMLLLCGKKHPESLPVAEFMHRLEADMARFGHRALKAEKNQGVDWKALSHAVRALYQAEELLATGTLVFPLAKRERLLAVKLGQISWEEIENEILNRLEHLPDLHSASPYALPAEHGAAHDAILAIYGLTHPSKQLNHCK